MEMNYELIKKRRKELGMTQDEVVDAVQSLVGQFSQSAFVKIEKGLSKRSRFLPAVCRALDLELSKVDPAMATETEQKTIESVLEKIYQMPLHEQIFIARSIFDLVSQKATSNEDAQIDIF